MKRNKGAVCDGGGEGYGLADCPAVLTHGLGVVFSAIMEQGSQIMSRGHRFWAVEVEGCR